MGDCGEWQRVWLVVHLSSLIPFPRKDRLEMSEHCFIFVLRVDCVPLQYSMAKPFRKQKKNQRSSLDAIFSFQSIINKYTHILNIKVRKGT